MMVIELMSKLRRRFRRVTAKTGSLPEVCPGHDLMVPSYLNEVTVPSGPDLVHTGTHSSFYSIRGASDSSGAR